MAAVTRGPRLTSSPGAMRRLAGQLVLVSLIGCGEEAEPRSTPAAPPDPPELPEAIATSTTHALEDDARLGLRLPRPGTSRADVLRRMPECAADLLPDGSRCHFPGQLDPATGYEIGSGWWTYGFVGDLLDVAELEWSEWDVDEEWASRLAQRSAHVHTELTRRLGIAPRVEVLARWSAVEAAPYGAQVLLERRTWTIDGVLVTWTVVGTSGHHPGFTTRVRVEALHPPDLRVEMLDAGLQTGAPLLRLRGGPVPSPMDVPLWLAFGPDDDVDRCMHHEAVTLVLPDGRLYVGQYNTTCGGLACRVLDLATGAFTEPAGGCLWGPGIHHRAEAIGDGDVLLVSDGEGVGAIQIVHYDPASGAAVLLELAISPSAEIRAEVRSGGVDFTTTCDLPPGCTFDDRGEGPAHHYRWTRDRGLVATD